MKKVGGVGNRLRRLGRDVVPPVLWRLPGTLRTSARGPQAEVIGPGTTGLDLLNADPTPRKTIYMHVHKCAGNSVFGALSGRPGFVFCAPRPGNFAHRLSREYIDDSIWEGAFRFTIVRNPFARLVSAFKMFHRSPAWARLFPDFDAFVEFIRWEDVDGHTVDREYPTQLAFTATIGNVTHHCSSFVNPKYRLDEMHVIARLEEPAAELAAVAREMGLPALELPRLNATPADDYRAYYTDRTREIVARKYRRDLDRFGYSF